MTDNAQQQQKKTENINYNKHGRFEAVLAQIIAVGPTAFLTHKANVKDGMLLSKPPVNADCTRSMD